MRFDLTISLGTVLHALTMVITVIGLYFALKSRVDRLDQSVEEMKAEIAPLPEVRAQVAMMFSWWKRYVERRTTNGPAANAKGAGS